MTPLTTWQLRASFHSIFDISFDQIFDSGFIVIFTIFYSLIAQPIFISLTPVGD